MQLPPSLEMREELGRGAMGIVYRAFSPALQRDVAVKMLLVRQDKVVRERFQREGRDLEALFHPNVVAFHEMGTHEGHDFLVMEFVEGNLHGFLRARPPLAEVCRVFAQICRGLQHIHRLSMVHRDIKPANILMSKDWVPKITDFGLARRLDGESPLTADGTILGTFGYLAPEQLGTSRVTASADLYALGVCLYEAVAGRAPFEAETELALIGCHLKQVPPSPRTFRPDLPVELEHLIMRMLRKTPAERPETAEEVARLLDDLAASLAPAKWHAELKGRQDILERLERELAEGPASLVLTAPAGSGRSRLLSELALRLAARSLKTVRIGPERGSLQQAWVALGGEAEDLWAALRAGPLSAAAHLARLVRGAVLLVDDLDRLDASTRNVLRRLAAMPPTGGWVLSSTGADLPLGERTTAVKLPSLPAEELTALAEQIVGGWPEGPGCRLHPNLARWLLESCAGSPRRLKLLLLGMRGSRGMVCSEGVWQRAEGEGLPAAEDAIMWEIERLDEEALNLVRHAALLEEPIDFPVLERLAPKAAEQAVEKLLRLGLFEEVWSSSGDFLRFATHEVRQRLAEGISAPAARRMHSRLAKAVTEPGRTGYHLAHAGQASEALPLLRQAAEESLERGAFSRSFELWDLAVRCGAGTAAAARAGECLVKAGRTAEALPYLEQALKPDDPDREAVLRWLLPLKPDLPEERPAAVAHYARALAARAAGDRAAALEHARQAVQEKDRALLASTLLLLGSLQRSPETLMRSLSVAAPEDLPHRLECLYELGAYAEALALAEELGEVPWQARLLEKQAQQAWQQGDAPGACALRTRALERWRRAGSPEAVTGAILRLAESQLAAGELAQAEEALREVELLGEDEAGLLLGWAALQQGRVTEAGERFRQGSSPRARVLLAEVLRRQGQSEEACRVASQVMDAPCEPLEEALAMAVVGLSQRLRVQVTAAQAALASASTASPVWRKWRLHVMVDLQEALDRWAAGPRDEESTLRVEAPEDPPAGIEVVAWGSAGRELRAPWERPSFTVGAAGDLPLDDLPKHQLIMHHKEGVFYLKAQGELLLNGRKLSYGTLEPGDRMELQGWTLQLSRQSRPVAWLRSCTPPSLGAQWELRPENILLGRKGRRHNHIELEDPSVSRAHARLRWTGESFHLEQESTSPTRVNGRKVPSEKPHPLADGDLIQLGFQLLRFGHARAAGPQATASLVVLDIPGPDLERRFALATASLEGRRGRLLPFDGFLWALFESPRDALSGALDAHSRLERKARAVVHTGEVQALTDPVRISLVEELVREGHALLAQVSGPGVVGTEGVLVRSGHRGRSLGTLVAGQRRVEAVRLA